MMKMFVAGVAAVSLSVASSPVWAQHAGHDHASHAQSPGADRQAVVAERGSAVMPFDLARSTHVFTLTNTGGVQTVVSDDGDADQVSAIRGHLSVEAASFARGDFSSPAAIHGADMPGLAQLQQSAGRIDVRYEDVAHGGQITFTTEDRALKTALRQWFEAQISDHGSHASHGGE